MTEEETIWPPGTNHKCVITWPRFEWVPTRSARISAGLTVLARGKLGLTVVFSYKQAFSPVLQALSLPYLGIQSPTYLRKATSTTNSVVGSGSFVLESFAPGSGSQLNRRDDYK
jgi:hypothetical protein